MKTSHNSSVKYNFEKEKKIHKKVPVGFLFFPSFTGWIFAAFEKFLSHEKPNPYNTIPHSLKQTYNSELL